MRLTQRDRARFERRLVATLTQACETAKAEIVGFDWLTHAADYDAFPASLRVVWVFDTRANKAQALADGLEARMHELTAFALFDAGVDGYQADRCVRFDSEEECRLQQGGNWAGRLAIRHAAKG
jgi:hypothetical protein